MLFMPLFCLQTTFSFSIANLIAIILLVALWFTSVLTTTARFCQELYLFVKYIAIEML